LGIHISKQSDANTVKVSEKVKQELAKLEKELPGTLRWA
jgi:multidrug efflux pump subunit AcrB